MGLALGYVPQGCVLGLEVKIWDLRGGGRSRRRLRGRNLAWSAGPERPEDLCSKLRFGLGFEP